MKHQHHLLQLTVMSAPHSLSNFYNNYPAFCAKNCSYFWALFFAKTLKVRFLSQKAQEKRFWPTISFLTNFDQSSTLQSWLHTSFLLSTLKKVWISFPRYTCAHNFCINYLLPSFALSNQLESTITTKGNVLIQFHQLFTCFPIACNFQTSISHLGDTEIGRKKLHHTMQGRQRRGKGESLKTQATCIRKELGIDAIGRELSCYDTDC